MSPGCLSLGSLFSMECVSKHCLSVGQLTDKSYFFKTVFTFRYTPVEIPKSILVQTRNSKGPPTTRTKRVISRQDWCSRARDKLNLSSRLVNSATVGKYSELVGHSGGRYVGKLLQAILMVCSCISTVFRSVSYTHLTLPTKA